MRKVYGNSHIDRNWTTRPRSGKLEPFVLVSLSSLSGGTDNGDHKGYSRYHGSVLLPLPNR